MELFVDGGGVGELNCYGWEGGSPLWVGGVDCVAVVRRSFTLLGLRGSFVLFVIVFFDGVVLNFCRRGG